MRVEGAQGPPPQGQAGVRDHVELGQPQDFRQERRVDEQGAEHEERGPEDDLCPDADFLGRNLAHGDLFLAVAGGDGECL